jgi:hypothetical protein
LRRKEKSLRAQWRASITRSEWLLKNLYKKALLSSELRCIVLTNSSTEPLFRRIRVLFRFFISVLLRTRHICDETLADLEKLPRHGEGSVDVRDLAFVA